MKKKAVYPGSFDPITRGHIDIIERASQLFDEVVVLIMHNDAKRSLFTVEERLAMIENEIKAFDNVTVVAGSGLTVNFTEQLNAQVMIRGIRATSDYEYEMQIATANMILKPKIETMFLLSKPEYSFVSSSTVKEIAKYHGELSNFVSEAVKEKLIEKLGE